MAIRYRYDLYPRDNPRDGARLVRFTKLQQASYRDVVGVGSGAFTIRSTESEADFLDPEGEQYVRVVREDTGDESALTVGGFWINRYQHKTNDTRQTKRLVASGAGTMAYLARARMAPHSYTEPLFSPLVPQDPFDDIWRLYEAAGGNLLGNSLWRAVQECLHYRTGATYTHVHKDGLVYTDAHDDDRTGGSAIELVTLGFSQTQDSDGNAWTAPAGAFTAQVGETLLSVVQRLMQAGLYVEMDPDTFELRAWENDEHRRDRTGTSWGSSVVRFQSPTDTTIDTGNMLNESEREISSAVRRSLVWAGGNDSYGKATQVSDIRWEGFVGSDAEETDALEQLATRDIQAREEAGDTPKIRIKMGRTPTTGRYLPWEEVQIEDLITVDTGSAVWDYVDSTYPVAALRIELQRSGAWHAWAELGDSFGSGSVKTFQSARTPAHTHPPNPMLCLPGTPGTPPTDATVHFTRHWDYEDGDLNSTDGDIPWGSTWQAAGTGYAGTNGALSTDYGRSGSSASTVGGATHLPCVPGGLVEFTGTVARNWFSDTLAVREYILRWYAGSTDTIPLSSETLNPPACSSHVSAGFAFSRIAPVGANYFSISLKNNTSHDDITITSYNDDATDGEPGTEGDLPLDTVLQGEEATGTANRAARCDHQHAHGLLSGDEEHYHDTGQIAGSIQLSDDTPLVESGSGDPGTSDTASRSDHEHPADGGGGGSFAPTWQDWTPTVLQPGSLTITIHYAKYLVVGDLTHWRLHIEIDSNGTSGNDIIIGNQPAALQDVNAGALIAVCGTAVVRDEGTGYYRGLVIPTAAQAWKFLRTDATSTPYIGSSPSFALSAANTDQIIGEGTVRTA